MNTSELEVAPGFQTADHEDAVEATVTIGATVKTLGMKYPTAWLDVSSDMAGVTLWRPCWRTKNTTQATLNMGWVGGVMEIEEY